MKRLLSAPLNLTIAILLIVSAIAVGSPNAAAQDDAATSLSGRLGGSLGEVRARFGEPSWTDNGLVGYNDVLLDGIDTILVVNYDDSETVTKLSLVYTEQPTAFANPDAISDVVAEVAPEDGTCDATSLATSTFGSEVFGCSSSALARTNTSVVAVLPGLADDAGSYSYSIDPIADDYFEIILQLGTGADGSDAVAPANTATATVAPEPTSVPTTVAQETEPSGGLGLSQAAWESKYGPGVDEGLMSYQNQKYLVMFIDDRVYNLSVNLDGTVNQTSAAALSLLFIPSDSVYVGSGYDDYGNPLDYYQSAWLAQVLPVTDDFDPYLGAPPGTLFTLYSLNSDGAVDTLLIAASASP